MANNLGHLVKQAQQMQQRMGVLQKELEKKEIDISSGGGMVKIKINGKQKILDLVIDEECVDPSDIEMLQEIIKTAVNQAIDESKKIAEEAVSKVTGQAHIPGLF